MEKIVSRILELAEAPPSEVRLRQLDQYLRAIVATEKREALDHAVLSLGCAIKTENSFNRAAFMLFAREALTRYRRDASLLSEETSYVSALQRYLAKWEPREISPKELAVILEDHHRWLMRNGRGHRANLVHSRFKLEEDDVNLAQADLRWANFSGSISGRACFTGANLGWAVLDRSELPEANFQGAFLTGARLRDANLWRAKFQGANLWGAKLGGALLIGSEFDWSDQPTQIPRPDLPHSSWSREQGTNPDRKPADLTATDMRHARLRDAKLATVVGIAAENLGGANLTNAQLPARISTFDALSQAAEASKNAQIVLVSLLVSSAYGLVVFAPSDRMDAQQKQGTTAKVADKNVTIPVIGGEVSVAAFGMIVPMLLSILYVYFHLYLHRLWIYAAHLPAIFPDGTRLDDKSYPWLLSSLVRMFLHRSLARQSMFLRLEIFVASILAWCILPPVLFCFAIFAYQRGLTNLSFLHVVLGLIAAGYGFYSYREAGTVLSNRRPIPVDRLEHAELRELSLLEIDQGQGPKSAA